jgi:hypothetical protein
MTRCRTLPSAVSLGECTQLIGAMFDPRTVSPTRWPTFAERPSKVGSRSVRESPFGRLAAKHPEIRVVRLDESHVEDGVGWY